MPKAISTGGVDLEKHEEITDITFNHEGAHLAAVHILQQPANGCPDALIFKADETDEELTKALEQIQITMSMEEYLRKFMHMYYDDAQMLTMMMGMMTEDEYYEKEYEDKDMKSYLEERMDKIKILDGSMEMMEKSSFKELDEDTREAATDVLTQLFKALASSPENQKKFEEYKIKSTKETKPVEKASGSSSEAVSAEEGIKEETAKDVPSITTEKASKKPSDNGKEDTTNMPQAKDKEINVQDLLKSAEAQDLLKSMVAEATKAKDAELEKMAGQVEILQKAEQDRIEKGFKNFADELSFLTEDADKEAIVKAFMTMDAESGTAVMTALEKAKEGYKAALETELGFEGEAEKTDLTKAAEDWKSAIADKYGKTR